MVRPVKGVITKSQIKRLIEKREKQLKNLKKVVKIQNKFQLTKGRGKNRTDVLKRINATKRLSPQQKKKVKIFSFENIRGKKVFLAGIPKGIKIKPRK